jgi:hypothetical protein
MVNLENKTHQLASTSLVIRPVYTEKAYITLYTQRQMNLVVHLIGKEEIHQKEGFYDGASYGAQGA